MQLATNKHSHEAKVLADMQMRYARMAGALLKYQERLEEQEQRTMEAREAKDASLKPLTGKLQLISTDAMVVAKSHTDVKRLGADGESVTLTVLDHWSGFNYGFPTGTSSTDRYWYCLKFYVGPGWTKKPEIIVNGDGTWRT